MWEFIVSMMPYVLAFTAPLVVVALGGLFSERSGVINIALEGLMIIGAFSTALFVSLTYGVYGTESMIWLGVLVGALASGLVSLLHAYASIHLKANQVISGTAINLIAPALTIFLARTITGTQNVTYIKGMSRVNIPVLSDIPIIGDLFFKGAYLTTFIALALVAITSYVVFKTAFGLHLRSCGEHPQAADSMGINVYRMRYIAVFLSGLFAGLGGAIYTLTTTSEFDGSVGGLGFLALAALIFGKWNPWSVLGAAFFFGFMKTLGQLALINDTLKSFELPMEFYNTLPYLATLIALVVFSRNIVGPKAAGEPYDPGKR